MLLRWRQISRRIFVANNVWKKTSILFRVFDFIFVVRAIFLSFLRQLRNNRLKQNCESSSRMFLLSYRNLYLKFLIKFIERPVHLPFHGKRSSIRLLVSSELVSRLIGSSIFRSRRESPRADQRWLTERRRSILAHAPILRKISQLFISHFRVKSTGWISNIWKIVYVHLYADNALLENYFTKILI